MLLIILCTPQYCIEDGVLVNTEHKVDAINSADLIDAKHGNDSTNLKMRLPSSANLAYTRPL